MEQWLSYTKEFESEIKILVCERCHETPFPKIQSHPHAGINRTHGNLHIFDINAQPMVGIPMLLYNSQTEFQLWNGVSHMVSNWWS
jgi:hypothetical protein